MLLYIRFRLSFLFTTGIWLPGCRRRLSCAGRPAPAHPWSLANPRHLSTPLATQAPPAIITSKEAAAPVQDGMGSAAPQDTAIPAAAEQDSPAAPSDSSAYGHQTPKLDPRWCRFRCVSELYIMQCDASWLKESAETWGKNARVDSGFQSTRKPTQKEPSLDVLLPEMPLLVRKVVASAGIAKERIHPRMQIASQRPLLTLLAWCSSLKV